MNLIKNNTETAVHYSMSAIGGFFGGYAVCNLCEIMGNAQTLNMVSIVSDFVKLDFMSCFMRIIGTLIYFSGFALSVIIPKKTKFNCAYISPVIDALALIILAVMPPKLPIIIRLYPIFLAMPFQWATFCGAKGFNSSTIFSTNNFRQFSTSFAEYLLEKDRNCLAKAKFYGFTLLSYHFGVLLACLVSILFGQQSSIVGIIFIIPAAYLIFLENKNHNNSAKAIIKAE